MTRVIYTGLMEPFAGTGDYNRVRYNEIVLYLLVHYFIVNFSSSN